MLLKRFLQYGLIILIIIITSCYKDITLDLQEPDIRPVVFGLAMAGKPLDVVVQKSYALLDYSDTTDKNMNVDISLFVNNQLKETLYRKGIHYFSNYIPQPSDKLKISFKNDEKEICAEGIVPHQIKIDSLIYLNEDSEGKNFNIFFKDYPDEDNYYAISAVIKYRNDSLGIRTDYIYYVTSKSPLIGNEEDLSDYYDYQSLLFTDTLFKGKAVKLAISLGKLYLSTDETLININLYLSNINKDYYLYVKSFLKNQGAQTPDIFLGNTDYINVHSNINNGYGIFKVFTTDKIDITDYFR
jgi:hypothetical protein